MLPLLAWQIVLLLVSAGEASCYYPNGVAANSNFEPCHVTGEQPCCDLNFGQCSNMGGLCRNTQQGFFYAGACTDQNWTSPECPAYCVNYTTNAWIRVDQCGATSFCCHDGTSSCCNNVDEIFTIPAFGVSTMSSSPPTTSTTLSTGISKSSSPTSTSTSTIKHGSILSTGAIIGIAFGGLVVAAIILYALLPSRVRQVVNTYATGGNSTGGDATVSNVTGGNATGGNTSSGDTMGDNERGSHRAGHDDEIPLLDQQ